MTFDNFSKEFISALNNHGIEVDVRKTNKVNETLSALTLKGSTNHIEASPYLERLHKAYEHGVPMNQLVDDTIFAFKNVELSFDEIPPFNRETIQENLYCQLISRDKNVELLKAVPHQEFEDLALIARFRVAENASYIVDRNNFSKLQMTEDEMFAIAKENTYNDYSIKTLDGAIRGMMLAEGIPPEEISNVLPDDFANSPMYLLSNHNNIHGAAVVTSKHILDEVYNVIGESNFYVIPSSIHEVLLIPETYTNDVDFLKDMVTEVNHTVVNIQDQLSDNVYYYNGNTHTFSIVGDKTDDQANQTSINKAIGKGR